MERRTVKPQKKLTKRHFQQKQIFAWSGYHYRHYKETNRNHIPQNLNISRIAKPAQESRNYHLIKNFTNQI